MHLSGVHRCVLVFLVHTRSSSQETVEIRRHFFLTVALLRGKGESLLQLRMGSIIRMTCMSCVFLFEHKHKRLVSGNRKNFQTVNFLKSRDA